jgi:Putative bacterial sensory transduction regulator
MLQAFAPLVAAALMSAQASPVAQAAPAPVQKAAPGKVSVGDPASLVAALQKAGYKAKLTYEEGKPEIESSAAGATFYLYFQNCESKEGCEDVMIQSAYDVAKDAVTLKTINDFNRDNRWARAYLDKEDDPVIESDLIFVGRQMDEAAFIEGVKAWDGVLGRFHQAIDW